MQFQLRAVSGNRQIDDVSGVLLTTPLGEMDVLSQHAELMAIGVPGKVIVRAKDGAMTFAVTSGHVHVDGQSVALMVTRAIDLDKFDRQALENEYKALPAPVSDGTDRHAETRALLEMALRVGPSN